MCDFVSWVEKRGKVKFLTPVIIQSEKFLEIARRRGISPDDYNGHGAIRAYYGIDEGDGVNGEQTDFSSPTNFPSVIVEAIKRGDMRGLGIAKELLTQPAWAKYVKVSQTAWGEYQRIRQTAWGEYLRIRQTAWGEEYERIKQTAWEEYERIEQQAFWDFFANPKNRIKAWR